MAYTTEEKIEPFWAEFSSAASGRDPLAIQNSSVVIYTKMVVGITNVTNRIRYNGFFCWIFDTILQNVNKKNSLQEQIRYSRRAELLLAYMMVKNFPDITGVSGSAYATNSMGNTINLKKGADWEYKQKGEKVYWQNSQGIFGQYYSGGFTYILPVGTFGHLKMMVFGKGGIFQIAITFGQGVFKFLIVHITNAFEEQ